MSEREQAPDPAAAPARPRIKRRWAILGRAGGGVAVIAIAGTLAAGAPDTGASGGDPAGGGDSAELSADR